MKWYWYLVIALTIVAIIFGYKIIIISGYSIYCFTTAKVPGFCAFHMECVTNYHDGGKSCMGPNDCEGDCIFQRSNNTAVCKSDSFKCGCEWVIVDENHELYKDAIEKPDTKYGNNFLTSVCYD